MKFTNTLYYTLLCYKSGCLIYFSEECSSWPSHTVALRARGNDNCRLCEFYWAYKKEDAPQGMDIRTHTQCRPPQQQQQYTHRVVNKFTTGFLYFYYRVRPIKWPVAQTNGGAVGNSCTYRVVSRNLQSFRPLINITVEPLLGLLQQPISLYVYMRTRVLRLCHYARASGR